MNLLDILPTRYTTLFNKLKSLTSKLQRTASSIGFIEQSLFHGVITKFANVKGQFLNERDRWKSSEIILKSQLHKHEKVLSRLIKEHDRYRKIKNSVILYKILNNFVLKTLSKENTFQLSTKNKKLRNLSPKQSSYNYSKVPIMNLSSVQSIDVSPLEHGLKQCFVHKNKYIKKDIAAEFETLCSSVDNDISPGDMENFHEFFRSATNPFTQNVHRTKDSTYSLLKPLQRNKGIVLLSGNKDSSVVILDKACYNEKNNRLLNDGISKGFYVIEENSNTLTELKSFQNFIYRNIKKHEKYKEMRPTSSQPARLFVTWKTHQFTDIKQVNINDLKLRPIVDQTGTHLYDCSKIIAQYLQSLVIKEYTISDTLSFPDILRENPLDSNEEYVSYDVDSLFTSTPLSETIDFTLDETYVRKKLEPFCKKSVQKVIK